MIIRIIRIIIIIINEEMLMNEEIKEVKEIEKK